MKNKRKNNKRKYNFWYDFVKVTGLIPALIWIRPKVIRLGEESKKVKGGVLIASNHVTYVDPIILHCAFLKRRLFSVATKDVCKTKLRKFFFSMANCIIIDKQNFALASLREICDVLKQEKAVVIFPESSVSKEENINSYKSGFVLMSLLSKKPILPVCIIKRKRWFERMKIVIGEPINVSDICGNTQTVEELEKVSELLQQKEQEMLTAFRDK